MGKEGKDDGAWGGVEEDMLVRALQEIGGWIY